MPGIVSFTKTYHRKAYSAVDPAKPLLNHYGRTIFVTGAGSGLGRAAAIGYAKAGAQKIILTGRREQPLQQTKREIQAMEQGTEVECHSLDVADSNVVEALVIQFPAGDDRKLTKQFSQLPYIDVLVNAAGYVGEKGPIAKTPTSNFFRGMEVNVKGPFNLAQAFLQQARPVDKPDTDRAFINYSSKVGHFQSAAIGHTPAAYTVSKLAAMKLIEAAAAECASTAGQEQGWGKNVRFYNLHPGVVQTEMSEAAIAPYKAEDIGLVWEEKELTAGFTVWLSATVQGGGGGGGGGREMPSGRMYWANWDVDELKEKIPEMERDKGLLTAGLLGWGGEVAETVI